MSACAKHDGCRASSSTVLSWMRGQIADGSFRDPLTNEPEYTQLAEDAAQEFDHDEWLDDEQSEVWDLAIVAFEPQAGAR